MPRTIFFLLYYLPTNIYKIKNSILENHSSTFCVHMPPFHFICPTLTGIEFLHWISMSHVAYWIQPLSQRVSRKKMMLEIYLFVRFLPDIWIPTNVHAGA